MSQAPLAILGWRWPCLIERQHYRPAVPCGSQRSGRAKGGSGNRLATSWRALAAWQQIGFVAPAPAPKPAPAPRPGYGAERASPAAIIFVLITVITVIAIAALVGTH